jgi:hypothetical protein
MYSGSWSASWECSGPAGFFAKRVVGGCFLTEGNGGQTRSAFQSKTKAVVVIAPGDGAIIACDANRPCTRVEFQPLKLEPGMGRICGEFSVCFTSCGPNVWRQCMIGLPKLGRAAGVYDRRFRSELPFTARNFSGRCWYSASSPSSNDESAGRGVASARMASQPSTGNTRGQSAGISLISWRCAFEGSCAMAASISDNDFTAEKCQEVLILSTVWVLARHAKYVD